MSPQGVPLATMQLLADCWRTSYADLKTTSVYAHARPGESSGQYLKLK
jgi:hypothetical protein